DRPHRGALGPPAGAVPARIGLRRPRSRSLRDLRPRDPRPRAARGNRPPRSCRSTRGSLDAPRLRPDQPSRAGPRRGTPGRDVAHPTWRASAIGVYRLWRDAGFAVGAVLAGAIADRLGLPAAIWAVAALTAVSGFVVLARMYESHPRPVSARAEILPIKTDPEARVRGVTDDE